MCAALCTVPSTSCGQQEAGLRRRANCSVTLPERLRYACMLLWRGALPMLLTVVSNTVAGKSGQSPHLCHHVGEAAAEGLEGGPGPDG